jgi:hypothetical protein
VKGVTAVSDLGHARNAPSTRAQERMFLQFLHRFDHQILRGLAQHILLQEVLNKSKAIQRMMPRFARFD